MMVMIFIINKREHSKFASLFPPGQVGIQDMPEVPSPSVLVSINVCSSHGQKRKVVSDFILRRCNRGMAREVRNPQPASDGEHYKTF